VHRIDLLASRPQYLAHLQPVWDALPRVRRGRDDGPSGTDAVLVASAQDLALAHRLHYRHVAYLEHGIGQTYGPELVGYPGGIGRGTVGLFLSPNEHAAAADRAAYPRTRVAVVGDPTLESLPHREPGPTAVAVSFHWECHALPETRSALGHYRRALAPLAERWPLIGHGHPKAHRELARLWRSLGVEFVPSWPEVLRRADVYVCDNSSTIFEFASTGRPVVVLNAPWYRRDVEHGLRFWPAASVGVQVDQPGELAGAIERAMDDPPAQQHRRDMALRLVYAHRTGAATRAAAAIEEWLG
jgi:hypothetical protein